MNKSGLYTSYRVGARVLTPIAVREPYGTVGNWVCPPNPDLPSILALGLYYYDRWCQDIWKVVELGMSFEQFKEYGTGRCINCGFLGKKDKEVHRSECYEASTFERISGALLEYKGIPVSSNFSLGGTSRPRINTIPWCFVGKAYIHDETEASFAETKGERDKSLCIFDVISKSRDCPSWYPWREFATPKEHFEESMMLAMEQRRELFELRLEELNKQERRRTNKVMIGLTVALIIFAALQVYAALAVINPEHWLFRWLR